MTYYGGKELAASFRTVRNNTIQIAEEIPEESYSLKPSPDSRSIGQTLAHIAMVTGFQTYVHQNQIDAITKNNELAKRNHDFRREVVTTEREHGSNSDLTRPFRVGGETREQHGASCVRMATEPQACQRLDLRQFGHLRR